MERKRRREWAVLAVLAAMAAVILPPTLYVCGYFWLAEVDAGFWVPERIPVVHRTYDAEWLARMFQPAGRLEERLMGHEVVIGHSDEQQSP
jgi:hypothetical protein